MILMKIWMENTTFQKTKFFKYLIALKSEYAILF